MTKLEKKQLLKAAQFIYNEQEIFSCVAIENVTGFHSGLVAEYRHFFTDGEFYTYAFWLAQLYKKMTGDFSHESYKDLRVLMLLMFREAGE